MPGITLFCAGVVVSLAASWLLVSRLERLGERAGRFRTRRRWPGTWSRRAACSRSWPRTGPGQPVPRPIGERAIG
jgi:hypothetical protein